MLTQLLNSPHRHPRVILLVMISLVTVIGLGGMAAVTVLPAAGAQGAEVLRGLVGDQAVAQLETVVFQIQDNLHQWAYHVDGARPASPWAATPVGIALTRATAPGPTAPPAATALTSPTVPALTAMPQPRPVALIPPATPWPSATPFPAMPLPPTPTAPPVWLPAQLVALGSLPGEGQWSAYMQAPSGQTVAYRTFLQPDPQRPYAVAAIVAFDLKTTRLKFVLGSKEPVSTVVLNRSGRIPAHDLQPGVLLATFNGGFKARHGHFGAMVNGVTVVPPRNGIGTVALYTDGQVRIGAWGTDITSTVEVMAWRQNGPLIIHDGQVNPHTADTAPQDWGYTVNGVTAVWRSGLGISADGRTLYYVAGPNLTLPALTSAMATTDAAQAMQFDINNYWVHFDAIQGSKMQPVPLLDTMSQDIGRYLRGYTRDFFYVTTNGG